MPSESNLGEANRVQIKENREQSTDNREQSKSDLPRRRGSGSDVVDDEGVENKSTENRVQRTENRANKNFHS